MQKLSEVSYEVQHYSRLRHRWGKIVVYNSLQKAKAVCLIYDGNMRILCRRKDLDNLPLYALMLKEGEWIKVW